MSARAFRFCPSCQGRDRPLCLSDPHACPGKDNREGLSLPALPYLSKLTLMGAVEKAPPCGKTTVIPAKAGIHFMIFAFVFAFDSDLREGTPHPNPERMRRIYMAASVSSPVGRENVRAKGQRQRRKWIPAFAGMTNKGEDQSQAKRELSSLTFWFLRNLSPRIALTFHVL